MPIRNEASKEKRRSVDDEETTNGAATRVACYGTVIRTCFQTSVPRAWAGANQQSIHRKEAGDIQVATHRRRIGENLVILDISSVTVLLEALLCNSILLTAHVEMTIIRGKQCRVCS